MSILIRPTVVAALFFCLTVPAMSARTRVYVSLLKDRKVVWFARDANTGLLSREGEVLCSAEPAFLNTSADGQLLFVAFRSSGELAGYRIDSATGGLTLISSVAGGDDPAYLAPDRTGRYLAAAYYQANKVTVHRILPDGRLSDHPIQTTATAQRAHGIGFTSDNSLMLVPHTGANRIYVFGFDVRTGLLAAGTPPYLSTPAANEPRHIVLHPSDRWVYTSDEKGDSISVYDLSGSLLQLKQTVSTIPDDFDGAANSTARCLMSPDGRFVYVANRGHNSIACFSVDAETGRVQSVGRIPTEAVPRSFSIDATGTHLYVAGQASGRLAAYRIEPTGQLRPLAVYDSGPVSWAVQCVGTR